MQTLANIFIIIHASLGGIALLAGAIAVLSKKGSTLHKCSGKIFYYTMLSSAISALVIAVLPGHHNAFLFSIGVFSSYFILGGYRSLAFRRKDLNLQIDRLLAKAIIITGVIMILYPIILESKLNIILLIFGSIGVLFGIRDLKLFRDKQKLKSKWLKLHIGKMMGGYIAAVSAFFVVNNILPGLWNWFVPGIVGSVYISYWMTKLNLASRKKISSRNNS